MAGGSRAAGGAVARSLGTRIWTYIYRKRGLIEAIESTENMRGATIEIYLRYFRSFRNLKIFSNTDITK